MSNCGTLLGVSIVIIWRIPSSGKLRCVALVRTDVSEEHIVILVTVMMYVISSSKTLVLTRAAWHHISEVSILRSHHHENLISYIIFFNSLAISESKLYAVLIYFFLIELHGIYNVLFMYITTYVWCNGLHGLIFSLLLCDCSPLVCLLCNKICYYVTMIVWHLWRNYKIDSYGKN
jgi:hypothetical protein